MLYATAGIPLSPANADIIRVLFRRDAECDALRWIRATIGPTAPLRDAEPVLTAPRGGAA